MYPTNVNRRFFMKVAAPACLAPALYEQASAFQAAGNNVVTEVARPAADKSMELGSKPKHVVKFGVIGMDHSHIFGMTAALQRGGGELVSVFSTNGNQSALAAFKKRFGDVNVAESADKILNDPSIQLVAGAPIPISEPRWVLGSWTTAKTT